MIANSWKIFDPTSADKHDRVLLQIMSDAGYIRSHFDSVREPDAGHFAQRRVRLFGGGSIDARTHPAFLWTALQGRRGVFAPLLFSAFSD